MTLKSLFSHQISGVSEILSILSKNRSRSALLADPPGGGKSAIACTVAKSLSVKRILILCPASLRENWSREVSMWYEDVTSFPLYTGGISVPFWADPCAVICSYDLATRPGVFALLKAEKWDMLICDESHYLKSAKSLRTKVALIHLWEKSTYKLLLSGTPVPNGRAAEAFTTFSRLLPERFGSWKAFKERYCVEEMTPYGPTYPWSKNLDELGRIAKHNFMVRRTREEVMASLPPLLRSEVPLSIPEINLDPDISDIGDIARRVLESLDSNVPLQSDHIATARMKLGNLKVPFAIEYIKELLEEEPKSPLVLFAHHRTVIHSLQQAFPNAVTIQGDTSPAARQEAIDKFQSGQADIFIGSISAASTGITLTRSSTVIFVEYDWVPSTNEQAEGRVLRLTQASNCVRAIYLYVPKSLDQAVLKSVLRKQRDITRVLAA